jgi:hypothetical protein
MYVKVSGLMSLFKITPSTVKKIRFKNKSFSSLFIKYY